MGDRRARDERRRLTRALIPMLQQTVGGLTRRRAEEAAPRLAEVLIRSGWLKAHDEHVRAEGRR